MSYDPGHQPPHQQPAEPKRAWPKRHPVWAGLIVLAAIPFAAGGVSGAKSALSPQHPAAATAATTTKAPATTAPAAAATTAAPTPSPTPTPTVTRTVTQVEFKVSGIGTPSITYGSDSDNRSPQGGLGFDGQGQALPWHGSIRYHSSALYWAIDAQLEGSGDISCKVLLKVTRYWSDGTHLSRSKVIAHGHASGGYNICDAQFNND